MFYFCLSIICFMAVSHAQDGHCDLNWERFGSSCYLLVDTLTDWHEAENNCNDFSGNLASFHSAEEYTFITQMSSSTVFFGLHDTQQEGVWIYSDETTFDYRNWNTGEPNDHRNGEDCATIAAGGLTGEDRKWNDVPCDHKYFYVCKKPAEKFDLNVTLTEGYVTGTSVQLLWSEAPYNHTKYLKILVTNTDEGQWKILSSEKTAMVLTKLKPDTSYRILLEVFLTNGKKFVTNTLIVKTAQDSTAAPPTTIDDYLLDFTLSGINVNETSVRFSWPVNHYTEIDYVRILASNDQETKSGQWKTIFNNEVATILTGLKPDTSYRIWLEFYFKNGKKISTEKSRIRTLQKTTSTTTDWQCESGWQPFGFFCYLLVDTPTDWHSAEDDCLSRSSHLASIHTKEEHTFITTLTTETILFGLHDKEVEGRWVYADGTEFHYSNWNKGEPNNQYSTGEDCATINTRISAGGEARKWNDVPCNRQYYYVCKKREGMFDFNLAISDGDSTKDSIALSWSGVNVSQTDYLRILAHSDNDIERGQWKTLSPDETTTVLTQLKPDTSYSIWLEVFLKNGKRLFTKSRDFTTPATAEITSLRPGSLTDEDCAHEQTCSFLTGFVICLLLAILLAAILLVTVFHRRQRRFEDAVSFSNLMSS